ncbi:MAG: hypothetical protein O3B00_03165 [archaeon]|nr:hypothetical protein [archaeon]MDA1130481.1 hypothetical protein [archaeon]
MADEIEVDAPIVESEIEIEQGVNSVLDELSSQKTSIWGLIKTLLSPQTLPHLALIVMFSTTFYIIASIDSLTTYAAMSFISVSFGYAITAVLSNTELVQKLTKLPSRESNDSDEGQSPNDQLGRFKRVIFSFRICIFPLVMSALTMIGLMFLFSGNGALSDLKDGMAFALGLLFIIWSIVQGRSFAKWTSTISVSKNPHSSEKRGKPMVQAIIHGFAMLLIAFIGVCIFRLLQGGDMAPWRILIANFPYLIATLGLHILAVTWSWKSRVAASRDVAMSAFTWKWTLMAQAFITWHALTIWRHIDMNTNDSQLIIEEVLLMIFTVFMAIWTLTSRGIKSKRPLFNQNNALPWGLSFGYAYAGSVAMLTVVLDELTSVMMAGHLVVILTILWMQRSVLANLVENRDQNIEVKRITKSVFDKKAAQSVELSEKTDSHEVDEVVSISEEITEMNDLTVIIEEDSQEIEGSWQQDSTTEWGKQTESISDDVEWSSDVIELDD